MSNSVTLALPSKGAIAEPTYSFLKDCGLRVAKPNPRQYVGTIHIIPEIKVLFQRVKDVAYKVADGTAQLGITGLDVVYEYLNEQDAVIIHDKLGYGHCQLVIAVPEAWVDVESVDDLAEIALDFRQNKGRDLRIATTYSNQARQFLHAHQIHHFQLVRADGAIEAAPNIGYADIVIDLTQTGTTLRENHLKQISGGTIVESQACLIGNRRALETDKVTLAATRTLAEYIDAALAGREMFQVTVDIQGESPEIVAQRVVDGGLTHGLLGPTVSPIYCADYQALDGQQWYTVTLSLPQRSMLEAMDYLRSIGGKHAIVTPLKYVFMEQSLTFSRLLDKIGLNT